MQNYVKPGKTMTFTAPTGGVTVDVPVLIGNLLVIPTATVAQTLPFEGVCEGQFKNQPKAAGIAWTEGMLLYWDNTAKNYTNVTTANTRVGVAAVAALSGDSTGQVRLTGAPAVAGVA